jgi:hypothetical protein
LVKGISEGFYIIEEDIIDVKQAIVKNHPSAIDKSVKHLVERQILEEIQEGRYIIVQEKPSIVSPLAAIPKSDGSIRLIHDASRPIGQAVNDYVVNSRSEKYQSVKDAENLIIPGCFMAKIDLKSAYRHVGIHPSQYKIAGLQWQFQGENRATYMIDRFLMFGARKSPSHFHRLTQAIRRMMERRGFKCIVYMDDFLCIEKDKETCQLAFDTLLKLLRDLGFSIAWNKLVLPCTKLTFLGIELCSKDMLAKLPENKKQEFVKLLSEFSKCKRASRRQLEKLAGKLNWACQIVKCGRTYLRRILDTLNRVKQPYHKIKLNDEFQADISWWCKVIHGHQGRCMYTGRGPIHQVYLDACNEGAGFVYGADWGYVNFSIDCPEVGDFHINSKELLAAVFAARRWAPIWRNSRVIFFTDNTSAKAFISKGTCNDKTLMPYIRELHEYSVQFDFEILSFHIKGENNSLADSVSRINNKGHFLYIMWYFENYYNRRPIDAIRNLCINCSLMTVLYLSAQILKWFQKKNNLI